MADEADRPAGSGRGDRAHGAGRDDPVGVADALGRGDRVHGAGRDDPAGVADGPGVADRRDGPLTGLRVVDLSRVLAGPLCTATLGDMGAEVVKVERPGRGDDTRHWGPPYAGDLSAYYLAVNRNKRSVTIDLRSAEGQAIAAELIRRADVLVDNFKLGTLEGWGFDDAWFDEHAPTVVRCSITGYGSTGPKAGQPGYDFILQAETGLMAITGQPGGPPTKLGVAIVDICTGMMATTAILGALAARQRTGRGQRCEVSLHDTGLYMLANVAANHLVSGEEPGRYGNGHPNIVPYRTYRAADGELVVAVGNDRQFRAFAEAVGHQAWADDVRFATNPARVRHRELLDRAIDEVIATRDRSAWIDRLAPLGIPVGPINLVSEALSSPQAQARDMVLMCPESGGSIALGADGSGGVGAGLSGVASADGSGVAGVAGVDSSPAEVGDSSASGPDGAVRVMGLPLRFSDTPCSIRRPAPALGQDTDAVLADLGYRDAEIARLRRRGLV